MEVIVQLFENVMIEVMQKNGGKKGKFFIDGFFCKMDQVYKFEEVVCFVKLVFFYDCLEEVMESRLFECGKISGRFDDNVESICKCFCIFIEISMFVVDYYEKEGKVIKVDVIVLLDQVFDKIQKFFKSCFGDFQRIQDFEC